MTRRVARSRIQPAFIAKLIALGIVLAGAAELGSTILRLTREAGAPITAHLALGIGVGVLLIGGLR